eukprot:scaffold9061_cov45-Prasinocladus_malaysianus.AAC.2
MAYFYDFAAMPSVVHDDAWHRPALRQFKSKKPQVARDNSVGTLTALSREKDSNCPPNSEQPPAHECRQLAKCGTDQESAKQLPAQKTGIILVRSNEKVSCYHASIDIKNLAWQTTNGKGSSGLPQQ